MNLNLSRRGFLGGALVSSAAVSGSAAAQTPANTEDVKLGVASYSLREFQRGLAIRMLRKLNVSYVSVKEFHLPYRSSPEELRRGAREFERAGIKIISGGVIYLQQDDDDDIRRYFEYAKACGMPMMIIGPTRQTLPRIEKFVKEYDIKVAIHNHGPEDKHFPSPEVALKALQGMDPRMGVCVDVGHTTRTGTSAVESIESAGSRLLDVHIKDLRDLMDAKSQCPVGDGAMPIPAIFKALKNMNYQGYVNLEYEIEGDDPMPGIAKSLAYMRGVLAGLRG
ncbi:MAG: sugar phosphate isomerase/epimerase family protein [Rhodospirillales bacterium]